jgi:hypothetical protein
LIITSHDATGRYDPTVSKIFELVNSPIPVVTVTRWENYRFNELLWKLDKWVLADYCEYDWDFDLTDTHLFGVNTYKFKDKFPGEEWDKFDDFVRTNPPVLYLKRELLTKDVRVNILPADYPAYFDAYPVQSKEEFDKRPISVFNFWGRSHEARARVHSEIWEHSPQGGYTVLDNPYFIKGFLENEGGEKWATFNMPHYYRVEITQLLTICELSKLALALPGCGLKTFRHSEVSANSVMVKWKDNLAWGFEWKHGVNCIECEPGCEIEAIKQALRLPNLYDIYAAGVETWSKYQVVNYSARLESLIKSFA